jgi:hypothetical protein
MMDHAARAREILDAAVESADAIERMLSEPIEGEPWQQLNEIDKRTAAAANKLASLDRLHTAAQVHATLALTEQQRIANLLVLHRIKGASEAFDFASPVMAYESERGYYLRPAIAEALGLA